MKYNILFVNLFIYLLVLLCSFINNVYCFVVLFENDAIFEALQNATSLPCSINIIKVVLSRSSISSISSKGKTSNILHYSLLISYRINSRLFARFGDAID